MSAAVLAFLNIGGQEMLVILVIGLLIFGRRLPEVGRSLGKTVAQLRRGLQDFKDQMDRDEDIREIKSSVRELKRDMQVPRIVTDPKRMLRDLTDEAMASPGPGPTVSDEEPEATAKVPSGAEPETPPETEPQSTSEEPGKES